MKFREQSTAPSSPKEKPKPRRSSSERSVKETALSQPPVLEAMSKEASADLLKRSEIHGDPFNKKKLTKALLKKERLAPVKIVRVEDAVFGFSRPFLHHGKRPVVIAYVEARDEKTGERETCVRTFYQSRSQGMWRYLPDRRTIYGRLSWLGKGHDGGEACINLPAAIQEVLSMHVQNHELPTVKNEDVIMAGTAREAKWHDPDTVNPEMSFYEDVAEQPIVLAGNLHDRLRELGDKFVAPRPEQMALADRGQEPRLSHGPLRHWKMQTGLYGTVTCETFLSNNNELLYLFCRDEKGRAWIGAIEHVASPIVSNGVRKQWVDAGNLGMPAYEYDNQAKGYGGLYHPKSAHYVDMYPKFLSNIPLIKRYTENMKKRKDAAGAVPDVS